MTTAMKRLSKEYQANGKWGEAAVCITLASRFRSGAARKFGTYFEKQLISTITELHTMYKGMKDKITKIKLRETINVLKKQKIGKKINDSQVSALMMSYELIKEIKNVNGKKS